MVDGVDLDSTSTPISFVGENLIVESFDFSQARAYTV